MPLVPLFGDASTSADSAAQKETRAMRQDLDALKNKSKDMQGDDALQYVRTLASRPKLTSNPSVLLAAIEMLVDAANKADHKNSAMYQKSLSTCRKYEEHPDFCGLVLKLFGSQEDKHISSLVADWAKSKKYDEVEHTCSKSDKKGAPPPQKYCIGYPGFGFPTPGFGAPYPGFFPGPSGFHPPFRGGAGRDRRRSNRIANGSITVLGRVEECEPPFLVLPITIEPSKPRMCHDERFLNLWIKDYPFSLDTLREVPREFREELKYWRFLDDWEGFSWRSETHFQIILPTDSSLYRWGAFLLCGDSKSEFGDYWNSQDNSPIHVKEANALLLSLLSVKDKIVNARVDAFCDNLAVVKAWNNEGGRDPSLNSILKQIFKLSKSVNLDLRLMYVRSAENPAVRESRKLRYIDAQLAPVKWEFVEEKFGPHSVDLMSLDSNAMRGKDEKLLKHFTPLPTVESDEMDLQRVLRKTKLCAVCGYVNDVEFKFCQDCGWKPVNDEVLMEVSDEKRLKFLDGLLTSTAYAKTTSLDVKRFFVHKDTKGKTQNHNISCMFLGKTGIHPCPCPLGLASGTVQSILGKLKAIFERHGRGVTWDETHAFGNPISSMVLDRYLKAVCLEQAKSHVVQKQF
ncbi:unnamed protein product [Mytilus coruscus]|uniref:ALOG domain-containing protein n=1 Tax=Mytilus coruscus TaxID=42192 RepID=A0A6J8BYH9_MYTCO|nr:unnamed protein product [Mytilus coruscus]